MRVRQALAQWFAVGKLPSLDLPAGLTISILILPTQDNPKENLMHIVRANLNEQCLIAHRQHASYLL